MTELSKRRLETLLAEVNALGTELKKPGNLEKMCRELQGVDAGVAMMPALVQIHQVFDTACTTRDIGPLVAEMTKHARDVDAQTCAATTASITRIFTRVDAKTWVAKHEGYCADDVLTLSKDDYLSWRMRIARTHTPKASCPGNSGDIEMTEYGRRDEAIEVGCKFFR